MQCLFKILLKCYMVSWFYLSPCISTCREKSWNFEMSLENNVLLYIITRLTLGEPLSTRGNGEVYAGIILSMKLT